MMLRPLSFATSIVALAAAACSDAPARPAKVGLSLKLSPPDASVAGNRRCGDQNTWDIGKAVKSGGMVIDVESPTPPDMCTDANDCQTGTTLEDGKSNANIKCTVRKNGSFQSDGGGVDPQRDQPQGIINFNLGGTAKAGSTDLILTLYTPLNGNLSKNPGTPACTMTDLYKKDLGALWASFDCPMITDITEPGSGCHASGTIVIEYCKTGEEED